MSNKVNGLVNVAEVYAPQMVTGTTWLRKWAFRCGNCDKDAVKFALFGKPKCPYCETRNYLNYSTFY